MKLFNFTTLAAIGLLSSSLLAMPAFSASFDCGKASTWVEKTVCSNPELSRLDEAMAKNYKNTLAKAFEYEDSKLYKEEVRDGQFKWLSFQRNTCKSEACLIREYKEHTNNKSSSTVVHTRDNGNKPIPSKVAFGNFFNRVNISMYNPDTQRWENMGDATNSLAINKVSNNAYLSKIESVLIFKNAHTCEISNATARWSENHWVLKDRQGSKTAELRLYPAVYKGKNQLLLKDIDSSYRELNCGMHGYFDGIVMHAE